MAEVAFTKGIQLRAARHLTPEGGVLDATNLVPDVTGALSTRQGMSLIGTVAGHDMTGYYVLNGHALGFPDFSYQGVVNGANQMSIRRDFTTTLLGPSGTGGYLDFADMSEFQNTHQWVFFAAGQAGFRYKDDGVNTFKWGIAAPSAAPSVALGVAGNLTGAYTYRYIFVRHDVETGAIAVNWGNPSPISATVNPNNQRVELTNLINPGAAGPDLDLQVTHAYIFRTKANAPDLWYLVGVIPAFTGAFSDNIPDTDIPLVTSLTSGLLEVDNGLPPIFSSITVHQDRLWGVTGSDNRVWYSKAQRPEQFSALGYLELGPLSDTAIVVKSFNGRLYVGTDSHVIPILGTDEASYIADNTPLPIGVTSTFSIAQGMRGLYWRGPDGVYIWNGATAQNITDAALYPLFHRQSAHGFPPAIFEGHPFGPQYFSAGGWFEGRYYLSYAVNPQDASDIRTMVYDEASETWYPDSRQFRRFHYDYHRQQLIGTTKTGSAYRLAHGTTDAGATIPWAFQSRDVVEGSPQSDQSLQEVTLDLDTGGVPATLTMIKDFGTSTSASVLLSANGRQQVIREMAPDTIVAKALGYRLTGSGPMTLYRLLPRVLIYPETRLAHDTGKFDLGWSGAKRIIGVTLDLELLESGTVTATLYGDSIVRGTVTWSTSGRVDLNLLTQVFEATVLQVSIRSTGRFRLYPGSHLTWIPLPANRLVDEIVSSDLGYPGEKEITGIWLDTELMAAGVLQGTLITDQTSHALLPQTTVTREARNVLTTGLRATLVGLQWTSTAFWRRWPGSHIRWVPLPPPMYQYTWPQTFMGTANLKVLHSVSVDLELLPSETEPNPSVTLSFTVDGTHEHHWTLTGVGRHVTERLRFPPSMRGTSIAWTLTSSSPWRLWDGELLYQMLGSGDVLRWPLLTQGGSTGPAVQQASLDQVNTLDGQRQTTPLLTVA
jgi:hypothetical protein